MSSYLDLELFFFGTLILGISCFLLKKLNTLFLKMSCSVNESIIRDCCIKLELAQIKDRLSMFEEHLRMSNEQEWRMKYDDLKNKLVCLENEFPRDENKAYFKYKMLKQKLDSIQRYTLKNPKDTVFQSYGSLSSRAPMQVAENPSTSTYHGPMISAVEKGGNQWPNDPWILTDVHGPVYQNRDNRCQEYNYGICGTISAPHMPENSQAPLVPLAPVANIGGGDGRPTVPKLLQSLPPPPPPPPPPPSSPPATPVKSMKASSTAMANVTKTDEICRRLFVSPKLLNEQIAKLKRKPTNVVLY